MNPRNMNSTVSPPKVMIDCIAWKRTNLLSFSIRKKISPVIQPAR